MSIARSCSISRHVKCANCHATGYGRTMKSNMHVNAPSHHASARPRVHRQASRSLHPSIMSEFAAATRSLATHFPGDQINFDLYHIDPHKNDKPAHFQLSGSVLNLLPARPGMDRYNPCANGAICSNAPKSSGFLRTSLAVHQSEYLQDKAEAYEINGAASGNETWTVYEHSRTQAKRPMN